MSVCGIQIYFLQNLITKNIQQLFERKQFVQVKLFENIKVKLSFTCYRVKICFG